ncbi:MAG: phage head closure protein [Hyphomicrobiales bacterium]|nr:phage head closure protein [Rickettsiales bacterium]MCP5362266.1 phage head closure protein [Hyphomicrobiales bacterium]
MKKRTLASRMDKRVILQSPQETVDTGGGYSVTWQEVATLWAHMEVLGRGREAWQDAQLQDRQLFRFTLRYRDGVTTKQRLVYDSRTFNIRAVVNPDERGEMLELVAEEGVAV